MFVKFCTNSIFAEYLCFTKSSRIQKKKSVEISLMKKTNIMYKFFLLIFHLFYLRIKLKTNSLKK